MLNTPGNFAGRAILCVIPEIVGKVFAHGLLITAEVIKQYIHQIWMADLKRLEKKIVGGWMKADVYWLHRLRAVVRCDRSTLFCQGNKTIRVYNTDKGFRRRRGLTDLMQVSIGLVTSLGNGSQQFVAAVSP